MSWSSNQLPMPKFTSLRGDKHHNKHISVTMKNAKKYVQKSTRKQ